MENRSEKALELHKKGYNCAQAVVCAYCDVFGIDEKPAFVLAEGFGAGMGGMKGTCGAASGMVFLAGMKNSEGQVVVPSTKSKTYTDVKKLLSSFQEKNGSLICQELKGLTGGPKLRSCEGCIADACSIVEEQLLFEEE